MHIRLLAIGCLVLLPKAALAQCPSDRRAAEILSKIRPISSHYVRRTLDRADDGIANARREYRFKNADEIFVSAWAAKIASALYSLIDTDLRVIKQQRSLRDETACLDIDLLLLETKMEDVRCELNDALKNNSPGGVILLQHLLRFLNSRYAHLAAGARDPTYRDVHWNKWRPFDDPVGSVWCCIRDGGEFENTCVQKDSDQECHFDSFATVAACQAYGCDAEEGLFELDLSKEMCPFHSDYLPPTVYGYGCDTEAMRRDPDYRRLLETVQTEYKALESLVDERDAFIDDFEAVKDLTEKINEIMSRPQPDLEQFGIARDREHYKMKGCLEEIPGFLSSSSVSSSSDSSSSIDPLQTNVLYQTGATRFALRGPFSLEKNETRLMQELLERRMLWGGAREQADYLKRPHEFATSSAHSEARVRERGLSIAETAVRRWARQYLSDWNREQAGREATVVAKTIDTQRKMLEVFSPLRPDVVRFGRQASESSGLRRFVQGFAWLLRRSCLERPCNKRLERILRIVLEDQCFPYFNGSYLSADVVKTCKTAADKER